MQQLKDRLLCQLIQVHSKALREKDFVLHYFKSVIPELERPL